METQEVIVSLLDFRKANNENNQLLSLDHWLKSKLMSRANRIFSLNFDLISEIDLELGEDDYCDVRISYRFNCILIFYPSCTIIMDRNNHQVSKIIKFSNKRYICSLIDEKYDEIYLITNPSATINECTKYVFTEWLTCENPKELWNIKLQSASINLITVTIDNERLLVSASGSFKCSNGELSIPTKLPKFSQYYPLEAISDNELISGHQDKIEIYTKSNDKWIELGSYEVSTSEYYSLHFDKNSNNIFMFPSSFIRPCSLEILHVENNYNLKLKYQKQFDYQILAICVDQQLGILLMVTSNKKLLFFK